MLIKLEELDRRLQAIERVVQNDSLVAMAQQVDVLERRMSTSCRAPTRRSSTTRRTTAERQRELYADLDARIQGLETALQASAAPNVMEGGTLSPGQLPVPGGSDRDNYQAAFELLKEAALRARGAGVPAIPRHVPGQRAGGQCPVLAGGVVLRHATVRGSTELLQDGHRLLPAFQEGSGCLAQDGLLQLRVAALGRRPGAPLPVCRKTIRKRRQPASPGSA